MGAVVHLKYQNKLIRRYRTSPPPPKRQCWCQLGVPLNHFEKKITVPRKKIELVDDSVGRRRAPARTKCWQQHPSNRLSCSVKSASFRLPPLPHPPSCQTARRLMCVLAAFSASCHITCKIILHTLPSVLLQLCREDFFFYLYFGSLKSQWQLYVLPAVR